MNKIRILSILLVALFCFSANAEMKTCVSDNFITQCDNCDCSKCEFSKDTVAGLELSNKGDVKYFDPVNFNKHLIIEECDSNHISMKGFLSNGKRYVIFIDRTKFVGSNHKVQGSYARYTIDGRKEDNLAGYRGYYGTDGDLPEYEIKRFNITIDGKVLSIPARAYKRYYNPEFCQSFKDESGSPKRIVSTIAVESADGKKIYVYMSGSDAAGSYAVKWIFDHKKIITDIPAPISDGSWWEATDGCAN